MEERHMAMELAAKKLDAEREKRRAAVKCEQRRLAAAMEEAPL